ncbi:Swi3-domain-containing protein [Basidiobolus meristosporus CBS 931.73]|uniref:Chromosome segregation in meiosis protein n=1 Tax=Basidiobolus meristosporus CBS 931.73 TaxID=1314790 RepID=A0A1Y1YDX0_9FUNG|nr:Swi3-domain-containing protein [Basidiobolus meristosporus CBS 931.73]|eukprot:ORX96197.1 Swi3-domain-containing protein [Basidiobolus meristosporus CBS 931.73]
MFEYELDAKSGNKIPSAPFEDEQVGDLEENQQLDQPISTSSLSAENLDKVKTRQRREPLPKLDANRLLQPNGLMLIKEKGPKLKFKGKGQEFEDLQHLLDFYQLWCHQLFPKMCFPDAIKKIENLCSERRLKVFREELIKTELSNRKTAPEIQVQLDNNRPETLTEWSFGDHEETGSNLPEDNTAPLVDADGGVQLTGSSADIEADQLRRIRENRERALVRLAARKRSRALELEEREEEESHKFQRTDEVADTEETDPHDE